MVMTPAPGCRHEMSGQGGRFFTAQLHQDLLQFPLQCGNGMPPSFDAQRGQADWWHKLSPKRVKRLP